VRAWPDAAHPALDAAARARVRARLGEALDPELANPFCDRPDRVPRIRALLEEALVAEALPDDAELVDWLMDELVGLGPLQRHMDDPSVTDILVNRWDEVFVERDGRLQPTDTRFRDRGHLEQMIQKIVALVGREISVEKPLVDARMVDGSRANAVYAPVGGPTLCIRKFNHLVLDLLPSGRERPDWVSLGGMSRDIAELLSAVARARANVLISGATGAGKSTLLRSLAGAFLPSERVVTIEDTAELELDCPHWVRLECVHRKALGDGDSRERRLTVADLVQNALRMRPDRLIVGEIRHSREAYHTLEALSTGHDGSATTIHAGGCADALARLELLVTRDFPGLPAREVRGYIARVFDVLVHVRRLRSGRRCVTEVVELEGLGEGGEHLLRPAFLTTVETRADGGLEPVFAAVPGYRPGPRLRRRLEMEGAWTS
jgi:pilus assembly protein CpaF